MVRIQLINHTNHLTSMVWINNRLEKNPYSELFVLLLILIYLVPILFHLTKVINIHLSTLLQLFCTF